MFEELNQVKTNADCLWNAQQLSDVYDRMAGEITRDIGQLNPLVLCVMNGGLFLTAELLRRMDTVLEMEYIHATRYQGELEGGEMTWIHFPKEKIAGRNVLLIDDILDIGITLKAIHKACQDAGANSVRSAVLTIKQHDRQIAGVNADYIGVPVEDRYVFGCGMDYKGYFRNLDGIYAVGEE